MKYVAVVLLNPTASSDGHENSKHIDVCSMHCVSVVAGCVDSFMGLSEVPSEKMPDLKPAPRSFSHIAEDLRRLFFFFFLQDPMCHFTLSRTR